MIEKEFNLFSVYISFTFRNYFILYLFSLYELMPILILSTDRMVNEENLLSSVLKFVSLPHHLELINKKLPNSCPWANIDFNSANNNFSSKFNFITSIVTINLKNLGLDMNFCKISDIFSILFFILNFIILIIIFLLSHCRIFKTKTSKVEKINVTLLVNFLFILLRPLGQYFFLIFFNSIVGFVKFNLTMSELAGSNGVYFILSMSSLVIFTLISIYTIITFRNFSNDYIFDHRTLNFDLFVLVLKILISLIISLKKHYMTDNIVFLTLSYRILVVSFFIQEYFYNQYVNNIEFNYIRLLILFFSAGFIFFNCCADLFGISTPENILFGYIIVICFGLIFTYLKYEDHLKLDFFTNTSKYMFQNGISGFIRKSLYYVIDYKARRRILKYNTHTGKLERQIIKQTLNTLNTHYLKCRMTFDDDLCPLCKIHEKFIGQKIKQGGDLNSLLLNEHLLIRALMKFVSFMEKKILNVYPFKIAVIKAGHKMINSNDILRDFNFTEFFFLKYYLLTILDVNLNRRILWCSMTSSKHASNRSIYFCALYLKYYLKSDNQEIFKEYKKLRADQLLLEHFNNVVKLLKSFLHDILIKEVIYSDLLGKYQEFGFIHKKIVKNLRKASKSIKLENKLNFMIMSTVYKEIFNSNFDKYLSQMYDMNENIRLIETRYIKDNLLIMDLLLDSKELLLKKIPTSIELRNIFSTEDLGTHLENFFPSDIRTNEKNKLLDAFIKNKTNFFRIYTYLLDKENYLCRVSFRVKIFLTIHNTFKIYAYVDIEKRNNLLFMQKNGKVLNISQEFYDNFFLHPKILKRCPKLTFFDFFDNLRCKFIEDIKHEDLQNVKKNFFISINMNDYKKNFLEIIKTYENILPEFLHSKLTNLDENEKTLKAEHSIDSIKDLSANDSPLKHIDKDIITFHFKQIDKLELDNDYGVVTVFTISQQDSDSNIKKLILDEEERVNKSDNDDEKNIELQNDDSTVENEILELESETSLTESAKTMTSKSHLVQSKEEYTSLKIFAKDHKKLESYTKNSKNMTKFCMYIAFINILILLVGIIFLVIVEQDLTYIKDIFVVFQNFMKEGWGVYMNILGISSFLTLKNSKNTFSNLDFHLYKMSPKYDTNYKIDMSQYIRQDLNSKLNLLADTTRETNQILSTVYYKIHDETNIDISTEIFSFSRLNSNYTLSPDKIFNVITTLQNIIYSITNDKQLYYGLEIINMSNNSTYLKDTTALFLSDVTVSMSEKNIMFLVINYYKNIQSKINLVIDNMNDYEFNFFNSLSNKLIFGLVILFTLNITIWFLTWKLLKIYEKQVKLIMSIIYSLDRPYVYELIHKIHCVNEFMNSLSSPIKNFESLRMIESKSTGSAKRLERQSHENERNLRNSINLEYQNQELRINFIRDKDSIITKFYKVMTFLLIIISIYFLVAFLVFQSKIDKMNIRLDINKKLIYTIKFPIDQLIFIKSSLMLNKTNVEGDYFVQEISLDPYTKSSRIFDNCAKIIELIKKQPKYNMQILNNFLIDTSGKNLCPYLNNLNNLYYDSEYISYKKEDISETFMYICNKFDFFKTDLFVILENLKMTIRDIYLSYVDGPTKNSKLKNINKETLTFFNTLFRF
jgi:hypothetical protein